ncbi:MAG TPA: hypothetical protein VGU24_18890 [Microvirga sp.]|jgi:hypothetical protein|nr:hypothetical protein [Microvirga sp.]
MEPAPVFHVTPADGETPGAFACFPYDGALVERFRKTFPRARWQPDEACWFVPGPTAPRRLDRWIAQELNDLDRHADAKGRDAYAFHPLTSPYLLVGEDLSVRTPYSRTVVEIMRTIPWARWDSERRLWRAPFRSYEELRRRWPEIEAAALRNEPEARRQRQRERKAGADGRDARMQAERRRRRYPVRADDPPPLDWPVATHGYGVVLFEDIVGEVVDTATVEALYPHLATDADYVWARWRLPTLEEVNATWPAREPEAPEIAGPRGWWRPSRAELQERRRVLRAAERAQRTRTELREGTGRSAD